MTTPASPADAWDAIEVLKIHNVSHCVGWAPSKGRRCHNPVAGHNQSYGLQVLERLGDLDINARSIVKYLKELAPTLLCRRWHQDQAPAMVDKWVRRIERLKDERAQQQAESLRISQRRLLAQAVQLQLLTSTNSSTPAVSRPATPVISNQQLPTPPTTPRRRTSNAERTVQITSPPTESSRSASRREESPVAPPSTAAPPSPAASESSSPTTPIPMSPPRTPTPVQEESSPTNSTSDTPPPPHTETPLIITVPESPVLSPAHTISIEECAICLEPMPHHTAISSSCGHSFHAHCINSALEHQDSFDPPQPHTCPYCRTPWIRRKVEGECSICCDELVPEREGNGEEGGGGQEEEEAGESSSGGHSDAQDSNDDEGQEELVWCELRCGKNYHAGCMRGWLAVAEELRTTRRCPDCRAEWVGS